MLVREIITPKDLSVTLHLPEEMVGKTVEVIAFEINSTENGQSKEQRIAEIESLTKPTLVDLSGFKFDRNEANNYNG